MSDIRRIEERRYKDGDWEEWPYPTVETTSVITGELRVKILANNQTPDDSREVTLIEIQISTGYSEYTQEDEYAIIVKLGDQEIWKADCEWSKDKPMARFMAWTK